MAKVYFFRQGMFWFCEILIFCFMLSACQNLESAPKERLILGIVHYQPMEKSNLQLSIFEESLEKKLRNIDVQITGTSNYERGIQEICANNWDISFALSPIVASQAIACNHKPIFPTYGGGYYHSVLFTRTESELSSEELQDLSKYSLALGQVGSASGYYYPLYLLKGSTLNKIEFLGDYDEIKSSIFRNEYDIGVAPASVVEADKNFPNNSFKIIRKSQGIPTGSIVVSPLVDPEIKQKVISVFNELNIADIPKGSGNEHMFVPNTTPPTLDSYLELDQATQFVDSISDCLDKTPVVIAACE